jgi:hypothetical protein
MSAAFSGVRTRPEPRPSRIASLTPQNDSCGAATPPWDPRFPEPRVPASPPGKPPAPRPRRQAPAQVSGDSQQAEWLNVYEFAATKQRCGESLDGFT